jgi:thiamine biosynthesis lipoprotein
VIAAAPAVHRFEAEAMGSPLRAIVVGLDAPGSADVWASITADVEASEQAMSRFRGDSEVTRLNTAAVAGRERVPVSPRLYEALATSRRAWRRTAGLFDPRVIADLERLGYRGASWDGRIDAAATGSRPTRPWLDAAPRRREVTLHEPVDLGGIGKGLALRWAAARAHARRRPPFGLLIEAGGDLISAGEPPDARPTWTIGIEDPTAPGSHVAIVAAPPGAVCT